MAEDNSKPIPTLEDVVEVGPGVSTDGIDEENIRIVADNSLEDMIDDPYDDEFSKLFEHATDTDDAPADQPGLDELEQVSTDADADNPEVPATNHADDDPPGSTDSDTLQAELTNDEMALPADDPELPPADGNGIPEIRAIDTLADPTTEDDSTDLWLSDWQEEARDNMLFHEQTATDDSLDILHSRAEIEVTDQQTSELIEAAVNDDDTFEFSDTETRPAANSLPPESHIDTDTLIEQIVTGLMPEIESKLRSKIREVLEQQLPPEND